MNSILTLLKGELQRAVKYKITASSIIIAFIFIGILYLIEAKDLTFIFPLFVFIDITMLAMLYMGAVMMFEKHEKTLVSIMVTPINKKDYFISKILANIISGSISVLIIYTYAVLFKEINRGLLGLVGSIILISFFHSMLGFVFSLYAKDFADLLVKMTAYFLLAAIPIIFDEIGLITNNIIQNILYLLPTKTSMILIQATTGVFELSEVLYAIVYMLILGMGLLYFNISKFKGFIAKESGA